MPERRRLVQAALLLMALAIVFGVAPSVYGNLTLLFMMMAYVALAQGLNVVYGFTGYLPFGYVGFFGVGAYGMALAVTFLHWPVILAVVAGGVLAVLIGLVLAPLLRLSGAYFSIANLAAAEVLYYVVANPNLTDITQGPYGMKLTAIFDPTLSYAVMLVIMLVATAIVVYLRLSKFGLALLAISQDPVSAGTAGVNVVRGRLIAWLLSAFIAGLVGAAFGWHISVFYPDSVFALQVTVFAIVFALFGGAGTVAGPIFGAIVLYGLYNFIGISTPEYFQLIYGALIVALVLFLPRGLASVFERGGRHVL
ncbi:MAG TPA: branched-chain amino acid ABC transporter permease [Nevskiaceae bacterium]